MRQAGMIIVFLILGAFWATRGIWAYAAICWVLALLAAVLGRT